MKKNKSLYIYLIAIIGFLYASAAKAICPVCTVAVGVGVGFSRWVGIDDRIAGIWVGGLIVSLIGWTVGYLNKKGIKFIGRKPLIIIFWYLLTIWPLYGAGIMGHPFNEFCGIDKLLFGIIVGTFAFIIALILQEYLKRHNGGKSYIPFQKVIVPVLTLLFTSLLLYFIFKC